MIIVNTNGPAWNLHCHTFPTILSTASAAFIQRVHLCFQRTLF